MKTVSSLFLEDISNSIKGLKSLILEEPIVLFFFGMAGLLGGLMMSIGTSHVIFLIGGVAWLVSSLVFIVVLYIRNYYLSLKRRAGEQ